MKIIRETISKKEILALAEEMFGDMVKVVVDIEREIMAIGGELHADEEALLLQDGSNQKNLWGANIYPLQTKDSWIEYDSMINIRPTQGNRSRIVESEEIQQKIKKIIEKRVTE